MRKIAILALVATALYGCVKNNPDPAWLEVTEWTLQSNSINVPNEGELTHNFTDAWVYIDNKLIGVFEVPFRIPVLVSGDSEITLYPTIKDNGISAVKRIYPFVNPYYTNVTLIENETVTVSPVTQYVNNVQIDLWDFEDPNDDFEETPQSNVTAFVDNHPDILGAYNGSGYLAAKFNDTDREWQATNAGGPIVLPKQGAEVYLEIDYHNDLSLLTGVVAIEPATATSNVNVILNPQDQNEVQWKKIYIDLSTIVSGFPSATGYYLSYDALLPDSLSSAQINLDNIKLIRF